MLNALTVTLAGTQGGAAAAARALASMRRQGFVASVRFEWPGGVAQGWSNPLQAEQAPCAVSNEDAAACCVGPIWYRGAHGKQALQGLLREAMESRPESAAPPIDESALRGNFVLFLRAGGRAWLFNDALGFARIHHGSDRRFFATSWLAARAWEGDSRLDEAAAIEYVLLGASHSNRSPARGVSRIGLREGVDLSTGNSFARALPFDAPSEAVEPARLEPAVDATAGHLRTVFSEIATAFPGRTAAALSGGFDSRLVFAGLAAAGERPRLFVYGEPGSDDVRIAEAVARACGVPIESVDKSAQDRTRPEPDLEALTANALFFDGLPNDGVFDRGADRQTRLAQTANGFIALNGGGGEIFRNFFHLPERCYRPHDIVRAFYRGFDRGVFRHRDGLADYESTLASGMVAALGLPDEACALPLPRAMIERIYPLFRCHHWMGVNNSLSLRSGQFATPLVNPWTVHASASLPLAWKDAGEFESRLIAAVHADIAAHRSAYGFSFDRGPDARARRAERAMCLRPVRARPWINALRRRLGGLRASPAFIARCRAMLPGEWQLDPLLDLERLPDDEAFARALSIEVVWRELNQ
jgi:asparagine synthase (glutamine-hydrolysing)